MHFFTFLTFLQHVYSTFRYIHGSEDERGRKEHCFPCLCQYDITQQQEGGGAVIQLFEFPLKTVNLQ